MQSHTQRGAPVPAASTATTVRGNSTITMALMAAAALAFLLLLSAPAHAASGGIGVGGGSTPAGGGSGDGGGKGSGSGLPSGSGSGSKGGGAYADAKLLPSGQAVAPASAPRRVRRAIDAANEIRKTKYVYGGGHASFNSKGYDCSGAVSYMLHGARMLKSPVPSGTLASWGTSRRGKWISVYANGGHTYAVVAGLRWDTSGGPGPRWHSDMRPPRGFTVRHYSGF